MSPPDLNQLERLRRAISALPDRTRAVYQLHVFDELDYPAIAERLDMDSAEVERHIAEAIVALERALREPGL